jgi:hypothetical protein
MDINYNKIKLLRRGETGLTNIYCLIDPISNLIRYIGKADDVKIRLNEHIRKSKYTKTHKNNWIQSLLNKNLKPKLEIIDTIPIEEWGFWEQYWIDQFKVWGFNLTNLANGGKGGNLGYEINKKISESKKGFKHSNETKEKLRNHRLGLKHSEKTKQLFSSSRFGVKRSESSKKYKKIIQLDLEGKEIKIWDGVTIASKSLKINRSSITDVCYGRHKSAGGYKWKLYEKI